MKVPPVRINWSRVLSVVVAAIESQNDHRPGGQKLADATAVVCRDLGIQGPSDQVVQVIESVVQGVFDQRKAGMKNDEARALREAELVAKLDAATATIADLTAQLEAAKSKGRKKANRAAKSDGEPEGDGEPESAEES